MAKEINSNYGQVLRLSLPIYLVRIQIHRWLQNGALFMKGVRNGEIMALTSAKKGLILSMRPILPDITGDNIRDYFAELFPPATLFSKDISTLLPCRMR